MIEVPLNHEKKLKEAYKKHGLRVAANYAQFVMNYTNSRMKTVAAPKLGCELPAWTADRLSKVLVTWRQHNLKICDIAGVGVVICLPGRRTGFQNFW